MVFGAEVGTGLGRGRGRPELGSEANRAFPLPAWVSGGSFLSSDLGPRLGARRVGKDPTPPGGPRANSPSRGASPRPRPLPPGRAPLPPNGSEEREVADSCGAPPQVAREAQLRAGETSSPGGGGRCGHCLRTGFQYCAISRPHPYPEMRGVHKANPGVQVPSPSSWGSGLPARLLGTQNPHLEGPRHST